jgi:hypothetical protein
VPRRPSNKQSLYDSLLLDTRTSPRVESEAKGATPEASGQTWQVARQLPQTEKPPPRKTLNPALECGVKAC